VFTALVLVATVLAAAMFDVSLVHPTSQPHFQVLAESLLHGRLDVPPGTYDAAYYGSRLYLPFGPLPAVLLMPAVAIAGTSFPLGWLAVAAAGAGAWLLWGLFDAVGVEATLERAWLVVLTLGGTCYLAALDSGSTYFVSHLVLLACLAPALALALRGRAPLLGGALVGLATLTRAPAVLASLPLALLYLERRDDRARALIALAAGLAPGLVLFALYNLARFGNPLEAGYAYQLQGDPTLAAAKAAGTLSLVHLPKNLYNFLVAPPLLSGGEGAPVVHSPFLVPSEWGTGLLFISPWLLAGLWARGRRAAILGLGAALLLLPGLLQFGGGWVQFGYRYSLDALPFTSALAALAVAQRGRAGWLGPAAAYSVLVNLWGANWLVHRLGG